jgi:hypothetical protein
MHAPALPAATALLLSLVAAAQIGCSGSSTVDDARVAAHRARLLLQSEPPGVRTVLDLSEEPPGEEPVAVVGRIGGLENPFTKGRASFIIVDPAVLSPDDHICDSPDCPHCAKLKQHKQLEAMALVEFADEQGQTLPIDARRLFGVQAGQTVVVRGRTSRNDIGNLVISADGMFIRE